MNFDHIIGNPPYQDQSGDGGPRSGGYGGRDVWSEFVNKSLEVLKSNGRLVVVHPSKWRKPEHEMLKTLTEKQIHYLEIHSKNDGQRVFGASVRYDWYVLENVANYKPTVIKDETGKIIELDLTKVPFIPNAEYEKIYSLVAKDDEERVKVLHSYSDYETRKKYMSDKQSEEFKYPVVHRMTKDGNIFWYSNRNDLGHFGVAKVILNFNEILYPYNDWDGEYGMSQISFGIRISSKEEGENIVDAINSYEFRKIIELTKWATFQTEWRMFKYLKKDFWKEFI